MASNSSSCSSGCYKKGGSEEPSIENVAKTKNSEVINKESVCLKCKANEPICFGDGGSDDGKFCGDCFRSNLFGKFRLAVTSHAMITPSDNVLVAFSGGLSSRVAVQFVHDMQHRAQKNYDASKDRSLPVFVVGVVFVDESAAYPARLNQITDAVKEIRSVVSNLTPPTKQLHVVPLESVFGSDLIDGRERLKKLLEFVDDTTGKEDLLLHLRMLSLQKIASENGYTKLVLGSCTSRIACHVLAATVKGRGYSLSADIQYVDARWKIPVVLPFRDCLVQELNRLCYLDGFVHLDAKGSLKIVDVNDAPHSGINELISSFVSLLQEENPSRESTIVRTAGKLTPFFFNKIPEIDDSNVPLATRRRQKRFNLKPSESISSELFCLICNGPRKTSNIRESPFDLDIFSTTCCSSCRFQILPKNPSSVEQFCSLLPQPLVAKEKHPDHNSITLMREKIEDCLLSDSEDEI